MRKIVSKDGTELACEVSGDGPVLILVAGALSDRNAARPLAAELAPHFTVYAYDRRGRGESGDSREYSVEREIEDIEALLVDAGGTAYLYGHSSGAVLALMATIRLPGVRRLALYEPPFVVDGSREPVPADYFSRISKLLSSGRRGEAVEHFLTIAVGLPAEAVGQMRQSSAWPHLESIAHTLLYDGRVMGDTMLGRPLSADVWKGATVPTLIMSGGASPQWFANSARQLAGILPHASYRSLAGQNHGAKPGVLAPVLVEFFS